MNEIPSFKIIVSKYNEDIKWTDYFYKSDIIIYDKSLKPIPGSIPLPNVGMNQHTYFHYIVNNYYNLPDYVIFLQGNPFDHMKRDITSENFQQKIYELILSKPETIKDVYIPNWHIHTLNELSPGLKVPEYYEYFFGVKFPGVIKFTSGSQYIIPKSRILERPLEFYEEIYKMATDIGPNDFLWFDVHHNDEPFDPSFITAWSLERFFLPIFGGIANDFTV